MTARSSRIPVRRVPFWLLALSMPFVTCGTNASLAGASHTDGPPFTSVGAQSAVIPPRPGSCKLTPGSQPPPRVQPMFAYDTQSKQLVVYGGLTNCRQTKLTQREFTKTWLSNGRSWKGTDQAGSSAVPPMLGAMTYDPVLGGVVLVAMSQGTKSVSTWLFSGSYWRQLPPSISPGASDVLLLTFDSMSHQLVLWEAGTTRPVWLSNGRAWTRAPTIPPSIGTFFASSMAYDPALGMVVVVGSNGERFEALGFNGNKWVRLTASATPPTPSQAPLGPILTFDSKAGRLLLYFGEPDSTAVGETPINQTWMFNGYSWVDLHPPKSPPIRNGAALTYDSALGAPVLFGGAGPVVAEKQVLYSDLWAFKGGSWIRLLPG